MSERARHVRAECTHARRAIIRRARVRAPSAFVASSIAWALLLPLAPFVAAQPHAGAVGYRVRCRRLWRRQRRSVISCPERSFHLWGAQMPVCARCTGIYAGAAIAVIVAASIAARARLRRGLSAMPIAPCVGGASAPLAGAPSSHRRDARCDRRSSTNGRPATCPSNWIRAAAGAAARRRRRVDGPVGDAPRTRAEDQVN